MASKRAVIYARFSTDKQNDKSIDDQVGLCRKVAKENDLNVITIYSDRAKTSATMIGRDGLAELLQAARKKQFDVLIVECTDRLARSADLEYIFKRLEFNGIPIWAGDKGGFITATDVGVGQLVGGIRLRDGSNQVRRHHTGRVHEGSIPGSLPYGYRFVAEKDARGEVVITHKNKVARKPQIDPERSAIVQRIFEEYVQGKSPRSIAIGLTKAGIVAPRGPHWNYQYLISSNGAERHGILTNPTYIGRLEWNKNRTFLNPDTGKRNKRPSPKDAFEIAMPHLRIIDQKLWDAAQAMRAQRSRKTERKGKASPFIARGPHMLAGLLRCGVCHGPMRTRGRSHGVPYVACAAADRHQSCGHARTYNLDRMQALVLDGMRKNLADPKAVVEAARAYHAEYAAQEKKNRVDAHSLQQDVNRLEIKIGRIVAAFGDDDDPSPALYAKLKALEVEKASLGERLRLVKADSNVVTLHPAALKRYQANIELLHRGLSKDAVSEEDKAAFRTLVDCIVVHPTDRGERYEVTPYGRLSAVLGNMNLSPTKRSVKKMIADQGVSGCYKGASEVTDVSKQHQSAACYKDGSVITEAPMQQQTVALGRWKEAA